MDNQVESVGISGVPAYIERFGGSRIVYVFLFCSAHVQDRRQLRVHIKFISMYEGAEKYWKEIHKGLLYFTNN